MLGAGLGGLGPGLHKCYVRSGALGRQDLQIVQVFEEKMMTYGLIFGTNFEAVGISGDVVALGAGEAVEREFTVGRNNS